MYLFSPDMVKSAFEHWKSSLTLYHGRVSPSFSTLHADFTDQLGVQTYKGAPDWSTHEVNIRLEQDTLTVDWLVEWLIHLFFDQLQLVKLVHQF